LRILGNSILNWSMFLFYFVHLRDSQSGMWVFRQHILPRFNITSDGMSFLRGIEDRGVTRRDLRCTELPDILSGTHRRKQAEHVEGWLQ
jgi:hypothetical protein